MAPPVSEQPLNLLGRLLACGVHELQRKGVKRANLRLCAAPGEPGRPGVLPFVAAQEIPLLDDLQKLRGEVVAFHFGERQGRVRETGRGEVLPLAEEAVGLVEVFSIGLIFSWLLWRTGSLWVPIFCHAAYNSLIVLVLRFVDLPPPPA